MSSVCSPVYPPRSLAHQNLFFHSLGWYFLIPIPYWLNVLLCLVSSGGGSSSRSYWSADNVALFALHWNMEKSAYVGMMK
jgi:hypothetical protein